MLRSPDCRYRLYLEQGRIINLYDWFNAFSTVMESKPANAKATRKKAGSGKREVSDEHTAEPSSSSKQQSALLYVLITPSIRSLRYLKFCSVDINSARARFLQATAELHIMGFFKSSERRLDHVMKLSFTFQ